ncbi:MAG TPA: sulfite exporter TauE/SafE family protein [Burkholderiaceae bacterium]|nr:sulfite exporter TauE/SafE family protein [Burkholderiaceae bacterium]
MRGRADGAVLRTVLPGAMLGIAIGALAFLALDVRWVKAILGAESVAFALHRIFARHAIAAAPARPPSRWLGGWWGAVSGFTSTLAHAGSPPLMQYLLPLKLDKERLVSTTVIYFTAVNLAKLPPYAALGLLDAGGLGASLALAPFVPIGYWAGMRLVKWLPEPGFYRGLVGSLLLIGIKLLADAFVG